MDVTTWFLLLSIAVSGVASRNPCACRRRSQNECANPALNNCDVNATCTDLDDGFSCTCNTGFTGNGTMCVELCDGVPCDSGENKTCFMNQSCVCIPGLNELGGICVESCETYGETFNDYPGIFIDCDPLINTLGSPNLEHCKSLCVNQTGCISAFYVTSLNECSQYGCDTLGDNFSNDVTTSVRNCA